VSPQASSLVLFASWSTPFRTIHRHDSSFQLESVRGYMFLLMSHPCLLYSFPNNNNFVSHVLAKSVWAPETATFRWSSLSCQGAGVYCGRYSLFSKLDDISMVVRSLCIIIRVGPLTGHTELHPFLLVFCPIFRVCAFLFLALICDV
jgi:hypothetical protein